MFAAQLTEAGGQYGGEIDGLGQDQQETRTKLIVNYLPQSLDDQQLCAIFSTIGPVSSAKVIRDQATNYSYGYGFVEYNSPDDAKEAIEKLKGYPIQNKRLGVAFARSYDKESLKNTNLYVSNIPQSHADEAALKQLFSQFGTIINLKMLTDDRTHQARGTAFIRFDRREEAEEAIRQLNGHQLPGSQEPLNVKVSEEHGKQKANHYHHFANKYAGGQQQHYMGAGQSDNYFGYNSYQQQQHYQPRGGHRGGRGRGGGHYEQRGRGGGRGYHGGGRGDGHHYQRGGGHHSGGNDDYHYQRGGGSSHNNTWN